jgi:tRNA A37 methylthiotransferase MiaB
MLFIPSMNQTQCCRVNRNKDAQRREMAKHLVGKHKVRSYKVLIDSGLWSCESNLVSCSRIYRYLINNGHEITYDASEADYIIINSCGVVKGTVDKCLSLFTMYATVKKKDATIIMFGCLVKIDSQSLDTLDLVRIGPDESYKLDEYFSTKTSFEKVAPYCDEETKKLLFHKQAPFSVAETFPFFISRMFLPFSKRIRYNYQRYLKNIRQTNRVFIEIGRGCVGDCSYCTIKKAKEKVHSRTIKDILSDITLVNNHTQNIFLVADDCGCYGIDTGENIIDLLHEIKRQFPNRHIDLNNLNPQWLEKLPDEYISLFREVSVDLVKIPIQSGSNKILKKMNRHYEINNALEVIDSIKIAAPTTFLYTHCIVGFPGENTVDFLKTLLAVRHFDYAIPFQFSKNKGTISATVPHQKSKWIIFARYLLFYFVINFIITIKLFRKPNTLIISTEEK